MHLFCTYQGVLVSQLIKGVPLNYEDQHLQCMGSWGHYIIPICWGHYIIPISWGDYIIPISWGHYIIPISWGHYTIPISWGHYIIPFILQVIQYHFYRSKSYSQYVIYYSGLLLCLLR